MFGLFGRRPPDGLREVLRDLFDRYWAVLYRQARVLLPEGLDPEDAAADVWLEVVREAHTYDSSRAPLPWLAQICAHVCTDRRRARQRHWVAEPPAEHLADSAADRASRAEARAHAGELRAALHRAVRRLRRGQREVVVMRFFFGLSIGEIAALKGVTVATATATLIRGLRRLRGTPEAPALRVLLGTTGENDD